MGLAWAEREEKIQVSALSPRSPLPLGTPAAAQPNLPVGPDAVPGPPCRWAGQGTGAQAAGDERPPARLRAGTGRAEDARRRSLGAGSETAQGALAPTWMAPRPLRPLGPPDREA